MGIFHLFHEALSSASAMRNGDRCPVPCTQSPVVSYRRWAVIKDEVKSSTTFPHVTPSSLQSYLAALFRLKVTPTEGIAFHMVPKIPPLELAGATTQCCVVPSRRALPWKPP